MGRNKQIAKKFIQRKHLRLTALVLCLCLLLAPSVTAISAPHTGALYIPSLSPDSPNQDSQASGPIRAENHYDFDVLIYGGGLPAVSAAAKAANQLPGGIKKNIGIVLPYPGTESTGFVGGINTTGGLNYWDESFYAGENASGFVNQGSYKYFRSVLDHGSSTGEISDVLRRVLEYYPNIEVFYEKDICGYATAYAPYRISAVTLKKIYRSSNGKVYFKGDNSDYIRAKMFIDASEEGRLARMAGTSVTTGRYDWPFTENAKILGDTGSRLVPYTGRQQSVTLMFKVKDVTLTETEEMRFYGYRKDSARPSALWGGGQSFQTNPAFLEFNNRYADEGFMLKAVNGARDGYDSDEFWLNCLLIFDVDGRANERDKGTEFYPEMITGMKNVDEAYVAANAFLNAHTDEILYVLNQIDGMHIGDFVRDAFGKVVTGDILYLRETVHTAISAKSRARGTENANYALTRLDVQFAGTGPDSGADARHYDSRIGLGWYGPDLHPYLVKDIKESDSQYLFGMDTYTHMRPVCTKATAPVYVPYETITSGYVSNLLIAGYAAGICSYAWGEMRIFSNLSTLGDAAGITAAYCVNNKKMPNRLTKGDITEVQNLLAEAGARLEK